MIPEDIELIIDKICRTCMCKNVEMHNVFEKSLGSSDAPVLLSDMLMACASVEVAVDDGLPSLLCISCESKLNSAFEFKQQCERSDLTLRNIANRDEERSKKEESIIIQPDVHEVLFDEDDDLPLAKRFKTEFLELTCSYCFKTFNSRKKLSSHLKRHYGDDMRYCPVCPAKYARTNNIVRHMKTHDKDGKKQSCKICPEKFLLTTDLFKHTKIHIEKTERKIKSENEKEKERIILEVEPASDNSVKYEEEKENKNNILENDENTLKEEQSVEVNKNANDNNIEIQVDDKLKDDDSMDVPLSQMQFSDDDQDNDDNNDEMDDEFIESKEDTRLVEVEPKKKRGRPRKKDSTLYECKECGNILTTYCGLKIHMRRHTGADLATCKHCDKSFTKKSHLNRHLRVHGIINGKNKMKGDKKIRECEFCDRKFKYKKSFVHHMQAEHGMSDVESEVGKNDLDEGGSSTDLKNADTNDENRQTNGDSLTEVLPKSDGTIEFDMDSLEDPDSKRKIKVHTCHVCEAQFARANHLTRHMTLHRSVLTHKCDRCDQAFFTDELLKRHIEQQHINKPYVCTICNKPFSRGEHLIRHLKLHQELTDEGQHKCSICDSLFARSDLLARHTKTHLMQDKRHVCIECGKAFNRLDNLKTHQRIHTGLKDNSKLHLCVYCGKEFNNSSNMIVHMRRHTGERPYKCTVCGKGFPRSHDLKCHERTHSGEKPYMCTLCGKSFNKSNKLLRHSRVHTGERPYVCSICSRAFTQSNDLALHMRRHTGARPYACGVCPARFIQSGQLKNHRRTSGHWMETQPDLKGGHRVEPVTAAVEPMPIKFKTFGKNRPVKIEHETIQLQQNQIEDDAIQLQRNHQQHIQQRLEPQPHISTLEAQPQRILMGIMSNINLPSDGQHLIIEGNKFVELPDGQLGLVTLPTVIQGADGEEIKLKTEIGSFNITHVDDDLGKHEVVSTTDTFHEGDTVTFSTVQTATTYTSAENFTFQTFN